MGANEKPRGGSDRTWSRCVCFLEDLWLMLLQSHADEADLPIDTLVNIDYANILIEYKLLPSAQRILYQACPF